jgi:hypothetical protein
VYSHDRLKEVLKIFSALARTVIEDFLQNSNLGNSLGRESPKKKCSWCDCGG